MSTSNQPTLMKSWKKNPNQPATPNSTQQRSSDTSDKTSLQQPLQETSNTTLNALLEKMNKMQDTLDINFESIKGTMGEMKQDIKKIQEHAGQLEERTNKLEDQMEVVCETITKNTEKINTIEDLTNRMDTRFQFSEAKAEYNYKSLEESLMNLELEKSAFFLRFQNITEADQQDLPHTVATIIAKIIDKTTEEILAQMDEVYRLTTSYARRNRLPREVHVRFLKRKIRDEIYNASKDNPVTFQGRDIVILRQIPKRVREKRKPYQTLATKLNKEAIQFRWMIPEGMTITLLDKKYKITSSDDAKDFYAHILKMDQSALKEFDTRDTPLNEETTSDDNLTNNDQELQNQNDESTKHGPVTRARAEARKEKLKEPTLQQ